MKTLPNQAALPSILRRLRRSSFRSSFGLPEKEMTYLESRGLPVIRSHAREFITARLAPAFPARDGRQTPMKGHPVFIAQHATATCCRQCLWRWHRIKKGVLLSAAEIDFIVDLIMSWIAEQQQLNRGR